MKRIFFSLALIVSLLLGLPAMAQDSRSTWTPSAAEIEEAIEDLLLCRWLSQQASSRMAEVMEYLGTQNRRSEADGGLWLIGRFPFLGLDLDRLSGVAVYGGAAGFGWSASASVEQLVTALEKQGFSQYSPAPQDSPAGSIALEKVVADWRHQLLVFRGRYGVRGEEAAHGVSLACSADETEEAKQARAEAQQRYSALRQLIDSGEPQPRSWVKDILATGIAADHRLLSEYRWLTAEDVTALLELGKSNIGVAAGLIRNTAVRLDSAQLDGLVQSSLGPSLIKHRLGELNAAQREQLRTQAKSARILAFAEGGPAAVSALRSALPDEADGESPAKEKEQQLRQDLSYLPTLSSELLDVIQDAGSARFNFIVEDLFTPDYTPAQLERALAGSNADLQARLVGRRQLPFSQAQYERGLMHPDRNIAFWYSQRTDFSPPARLVERGLTSADPEVRARWLRNSAIHLTPAQVSRALQDEIAHLRTAAYGRREVALSDVQLDACLQEADVGARFNCVRRQEMTLSAARFAVMVRDWNRNVFGFYVEAHPEQADRLPALVTQMAREGDRATLAGMLRFHGRELTISESDVRTIYWQHDAAVSKPYCRIHPQVCKKLGRK